MFEIKPTQLPPEIANLLLARGHDVPPLQWVSRPNRLAAEALEKLDDRKLFERENLADPAMAAAVRALLFLWNGHPEKAAEQVRRASQTEGRYLLALCERQTGDSAKAKEHLRQMGEHPIWSAIAGPAAQQLAATSEPLLARLRQTIEMGNIWEPFLFADVYEQARAGKFKDAGEHAVRSLQCLEFEMLFRHCYEAATGEDLPRRTCASTAAREQALQRMRELAERHRAKKTRREPAKLEAEKPPGAKDKPQKPPSPGAIDATFGAAGPVVGVQCPKCLATSMLPESARGTPQKCGHCGAAFLVPRKQAAAAS